MVTPLDCKSAGGSGQDAEVRKGVISITPFFFAS